MASVILKKGREKNLLQRHPWIFSGAIERVEGNPKSGETVTVCSADGKPLAQAAWSPESQIAARIWSFNPATVIDADFFRAKLQNAINARFHLTGRACSPSAPLIEERTARRAVPTTNAVRLVASESDGLPGLIIDRHADWLVCQFLSAGSEHWKNTIVELLQELFPGLSIYERSDVSVREKEGLPLRCGVLAGSEPPEHVEISENGMRLLVDIKAGHKTGSAITSTSATAASRCAIGPKGAMC